MMPAALSEPAAGEVAARPGRTSDPPFTRASWEASGGNPFLLTELARSLLAEGSEPNADTADRLGEISPASVRRSVLGRLAGMPIDAQKLALAAAILSEGSELRDVAALASLERQAALQAFDALVAAAVLEPEAPVHFTHPLLRSAIYGDLSAGERAWQHAEAARLLAAAAGDEETVASHLLRAEPASDPQVVEQLRAAAQVALFRGAPSAAAGYLRRAEREPPGEDLTCYVERELGSALLRAGDEEGIDWLLRARETSSDPRQRAETLVELIIELASRFRARETLGLVEAAIEELAGSDDELELRLRAELGYIAVNGAEPAAVPHLRSLLEREIPGETPNQRRCIGIQAMALALGWGDADTVRKIAAPVIADLEHLREDCRNGIWHTPTFLALGVCGEFDLVTEPMRVTVEEAQARGMAGNLMIVQGVRGFRLFAQGQLLEAEALLRAATDSPGIRATMAIFRAVIAAILVERGETKDAERLLLVDEGQVVEPGAFNWLSRCARGRARLGLGQKTEAAADFAAVGSEAEPLGFHSELLFPWRSGLAQALPAQDDVDAARESAERAVAEARSMGEAGAVGAALRVQAMLAEADHVEMTRQAVDVLSGSDARLEHAKALVDLGAALRRANQRKEAREPLREGLDLARRCGATPLAERAREELKATGARPRKEVFTGVESLTASELRIAKLAAEGLTNREIAQQLYVTQKTVETHLRHCFQKLDLKGRGELPAKLDETPA